MERYIDRQEAGKVLAEILIAYTNKPNTLVLALPRGGVPVAYQVAETLSLPLDVFMVRKLGVPGHEELAMGAIATGGSLFLNNDIIHDLRIPQSAIHEEMDKELNELTRREFTYRGNRPFPILKEKTIILIDDGIATGATMHVAIQALRKEKPARIIVAVPVAANSTCDELLPILDELVCPLRPFQFHAVGLWYDNFSQTSDEEVIELLAKNRADE